MANKDEEAILAFRTAFINLPESHKLREVMRLYNTVNKIPYIILEDHEIGKVLKFLDVQSLMEYLWANKHLRTDRSFLYKVLKGRYKQAYGYRIYYEEVE